MLLQSTNGIVAETELNIKIYSYWSLELMVLQCIGFKWYDTCVYTGTYLCVSKQFCWWYWHWL